MMTLQLLLKLFLPTTSLFKTVKQDKRGGIFSNQFCCTETDLGEFSSFEYLAIVLKPESDVVILTLQTT